MVGEPHLGFPGGKVWVYQSPSLIRIPAVNILYEINDNDGVVLCWSLRLAV